MEIHSIQHFENMQMMCRYFEEKSKYDDLYVIEFETSKIINSIIESEEDSIVGIEKILDFLAIVEKSNHAGGSHWHDYEIHVLAIVNINRLSGNKAI
ncbi:hypothetical protein [Flavobacterium sp. ov086]|uniref:hypothetical protein n=1 Tax=Flavobacterium sp. ov086 TaxID=1761785 RepID=UPI000B6F50E5|nr:hypothetical protein [Flavobacterium sp. ov086]SNR29427.1 hypothetical protein SAMN04487979_10217 [Flavobacterium sp. ov086]